jgi:preprotein translocase subunit SecA
MRARERLSHALSTARGVTIQDDVTHYRRIVGQIREIDHRGTPEAALREAAGVLRERAMQGVPEADLLVPLFALVCEACRRHLGLAPFDEQLIAGIALSQGRLAQMQTGEGKTLAAVFPACLWALCGGGVHILTANDYLAARDARWMGPAYELMGLRAAAVRAGCRLEERRAAYAADVTYLTAREAGFDYLRDGMRYSRAEGVRQRLCCAIVDEADFILIDEARIPLVIAGSAEADGIDVRAVERLVSSLEPGTHFTLDREGRRVSLTLAGQERVEREMGMGGIHEARGAAVFARVHAALHARCLLARDVDYVIRDGAVELVDAFTGRIAERRRWPWGIQAAIEAQEGIAPRPEGRLYGSITVQHFMGLYGRLAAMTATAVASAPELQETYGFQTVIIPTVKQGRRTDHPDLVFRTRREKKAAVVEEIARAHASGRPVLAGTASVKESQELAEALAAAGVGCRVLNASNDGEEAALIAEAGRLGAVTISTNMAGRGTDIRLAGPAGERDRPEERRRLEEIGGLYVIGTNRHESRRVDDQLRGRAGRQGEPGSSRFFVSLEDPLFSRWGARELLPASALEPRDGPLEDPRVSREIERAQSIIEAQNHGIRRSLRKYSALVELDRRAVRGRRDEALLEGMLPEKVEEALGGEQASTPLRSRAVQAYLDCLDSFWADHLLLVEEVREGIHLERFAGRDPGLEYLRRVGDAFLQGLGEVEQLVADACRRAAADPDALDPRHLGAARPSSTWTYQVDDELPVRFSLRGLGSPDIGAAIAGGVVHALAALSGAVRRAARRAVHRPPP